MQALTYCCQYVILCVGCVICWQYAFLLPRFSRPEANSRPPPSPKVNRIFHWDALGLSMAHCGNCGVEHPVVVSSSIPAPTIQFCYRCGFSTSGRVDDTEEDRHVNTLVAALLEDAFTTSTSGPSSFERMVSSHDSGRTVPRAAVQAVRILAARLSQQNIRSEGCTTQRNVVSTQTDATTVREPQESMLPRQHISNSNGNEAQRDAYALLQRTLLQQL